MKSNVIAIDGVSYVGKSTIAQELAKISGWTYVNTGHMFRAVARASHLERIDAANEAAITALTKSLQIEFRRTNDRFFTFINGEDWTPYLDQFEIVQLASKVAAISGVRKVLAEKQREYALEDTIIMEGRDIGSVVFPSAKWKFFISASLEIRAKRMFKLMTPEEKKACPDPRVLIPKIAEIDERDRNRPIAPLIQSPDAIFYDNSDSPSEVQDALILNYYMNHSEEIIRNTQILNLQNQR